MLQIVGCTGIAVMTGFGVTVTVKVKGTPGQPLLCGVIVYTTTALLVALLLLITSLITAVFPDGLYPVALPSAFAAVQVNVLPATVQLSVVLAVPPVQIFCALLLVPVLLGRMFTVTLSITCAQAPGMPVFTSRVIFVLPAVCSAGVGV